MSRDTSRKPVLVVIGTRPEAIKMLPVVLAMKACSTLHPVILSTGQHADMVRRVLRIGNLAPDIELQARSGRHGLNDLFSRVIDGVQHQISVMQNAQTAPALVLVQGDTTSAAAAAVAAFNARIPVGHVEAELRTGDVTSPFPEEFNRQLISRIAGINFAPTRRSEANLIREGVDPETILVTGNTGIDMLHYATRLSCPAQAVAAKTVIVTSHRRENWGAPMARIVDAVAALAQEHAAVSFVVPVHPNPAIGALWREQAGGIPNVSLRPPMPYVPFAHLISSADLVLTDSGGLQEEAPSVGTPVLVLRDTTERTEALRHGAVKLVGTDTDRIVAETGRALTDPIPVSRAARIVYGDGRSAQRIVTAVTSWLDLSGTTPAPAAGTAAPVGTLHPMPFTAQHRLEDALRYEAAV